MSEAAGAGSDVRALFARREAPVEGLIDQAESVARTCLAMATRFRRGGKLIVFGNGPAATDAQHVAVEFVHPVIVGKRALPAISLAADVAALTGLAGRAGFGGVYSHQLRHLAAPADIALGISADGQCENVRAGLQTARERDLLTVAMLGGDGGRIAASPAVDHLLLALTDDPQVVKEVHVTAYHVLWELVHVFLETPGSDPAEAGHCPDDVCVTCSDRAVEVTVVRLLDGRLAVVDTGAGFEEVSVALVSAGVGDTVLVHAKEAIAVLPAGSGAGQKADDRR